MELRPAAAEDGRVNEQAKLVDQSQRQEAGDQCSAAEDGDIASGLLPQLCNRLADPIADDPRIVPAAFSKGLRDHGLGQSIHAFGDDGIASHRLLRGPVGRHHLESSAAEQQSGDRTAQVARVEQKLLVGTEPVHFPIRPGEHAVQTDEVGDDDLVHLGSPRRLFKKAPIPSRASSSIMFRAMTPPAYSYAACSVMACCR